MNKYLIFRTDRIGDFLLTAILINSIKRNESNSHVTVVASQKNYNYVKSFNSVDSVILLKNGFFEKIKLIKNLHKEKYRAIIVHDQKQRSKIISFFLNSKIKVLVNDWESALDKRWLDFFWKHTSKKENVEENLLSFFVNQLIYQHADEKKELDGELLNQLLDSSDISIVNFCKDNN